MIDCVYTALILAPPVNGGQSVNARHAYPTEGTLMRTGLAARLLCMSVTISGPAAFAHQAEPVVIALRVRDTARVPEDVLTTAQGDVTRIYCDAGVEAVWLTPEFLSTESNEARQAALTVAIVSMEQAERMQSRIDERRVGFASRTAGGEGGFVYVIYDRVERLTGGNGVRRASLLAIAIAHEIGHLLLPDKGHSPRGLMRAEWTRADLQRAQRELTSFTRRQRDVLRVRISASRHLTALKSIQKYLCDGRSK